MTRGDIDATVAQVGFNVVQMIIPVFLLAPLGISAAFSVSHLLPGYALGFLVGSLGFTLLAIQLRRREGRDDVTAHVYGNNVPAIIIYALSIMLPVFLRTNDAMRAWEVGAASVIWTGIIKLVCAPFAGILRRFIPVPASLTLFGAAMYSYLAFILVQRIFDSPLVGILALSIVAASVLSGIPITSLKLPPFLVAWVIPLLVALATGYVRPGRPGLVFTMPFVSSLGPLRAMGEALPFMSVIAPMAIYMVLQTIAAVEGAAAAGDDYDPRLVLAWDGLGTLISGAAGSAITPTLYSLHPPYKAMGARIGFSLWTPIIFMLIVISGLTSFIAQLFPWPILAAMIAYVSVGVGVTTLRRVDHKYLPAVLLGFVLPAGALVSAAVSAALPALNLSLENPGVRAALNRSIYWSSVEGLGNGFLLLVLVLAAIISEAIDRNFSRAALWCLAAAACSWLGVLHSPVARWGAQPLYAAGWLAAAAIAYSARWWRGDAPTGR